MNLALEAAQVGPGHTSLGLAGLASDYRHLRLSAGTSVIPKTSLSAYAELGNDNLAGTNAATATSRELGLSANSAPIRQLGIAASYGLSRLFKDADFDSFDVNSTTQFISAGPSLSLDNWGINQTLSAIVGYQTHVNAAPFSQTEPTRPLTIALSYSITPGIPVTFSTSFSHTYDLAGRGPDSLASYQNYGLSAGKAFFGDRLQNSLSVAFQPSATGQAWPIAGSHSLAFTTRDALTLAWGLTIFSSKLPGMRGFNSQRVSLSYNRRLFLRPVAGRGGDPGASHGRT